MRNIILQRILFVLLFSFVLSSCGGGGGGSSDSGDSYSISTNQVNFTTTQNGLTPPTQYVSVNVNYGTVFLGIEQSGSFFTASFAITSDTTGQITVTPGSSNRTPGTYNGTITVIGCEDPFCGIRANGSPKTIQVSYTILPQPTLSASPASLSFTEDEGIAPAGQVVSLVQNNGSISSWSATVSYSGAVTGWLSLTPNTANNTIGVGVNPLGAGTYQATINVQYTFPSGSRNLSIPVSYTAVSVAQITPSSLSFFSTEGIAPGAQNITVGFGTTNPGWNATVQYTSGTGWLDLTPTGGNLNVQSQVRALGTYSANIIISYTFANGVESSAIIPVAYEVTQGVQPDLASVNLTAVEGEDPPAQGVNMSVLGGASVSNWSAAVEYTDGTSGWLAVNPLTGSSMPAGLSVDAGIRVPGVYRANVVFNYTISGVNGSITVPVTYNVSAGVSLSTNVLNFTAREGQVPAPQLVNVNYTGTGTIPWSTGINPAVPWLTLNPASSSSLPAVISVEPMQKLTGNASTIVAVIYDIGGSSPSQAFTVNYEVLTAWAVPVPNALNFSLDITSTSADLTQEFVVGDLYSNSDAITWSSGTDVSWLSVTASGDTDTNNTVLVSLVESELINLNGNETASITLTPDNPNISPLVIPVNLNMSIPKITHVTPNVRYLNRVSEVILRGSGFTSVTSENITFGGVSAFSFTVISDTEIHAIPEASVFSSLGTYDVAIEVDPAFDFSTARLHVVDVANYPATTVPMNGTPRSFVHDPLRNAIFYSTDTGIYKLEHAGGTNWIETSVASGNTFAVETTPDSQNMFVSVDQNTVYPSADPDNLILGTAEIVSTSSLRRFRNVAPMNNGKTLIFDSSASGEILSFPDGTIIDTPNPFLGVVYSEDRDVALFGGGDYGNPQIYDASDGSVTTSLTGSWYVNNVTSAISERANRIYVSDRVFDRNINYLGNLDRTYTAGPVAMSPDGLHLYETKVNLVHVFDISGTTGPFPEIGTAVSYKESTSTNALGMRITQDGGTLFIYDASTLYIMPAP